MSPYRQWAEEVAFARRGRVAATAMSVRRANGPGPMADVMIRIWSPIVNRYVASNDLMLRDRLIDMPPPNVPPPSSLNKSGATPSRPVSTVDRTKPS